MDANAILAIMGGVGTVAGALGAFAAYNKGLKKDGATTGTLMSDVGYIKAGVDDLKRKQETSEARHYALAERVTAVEASASQAHKRIDRIDKKE
jgi:outer membrane murein-binding lipoprotein Lpp